MAWGTEAEMVDSFMMGLSTSDHNYFVLSQYDTGFGRPDLIVLELKPNAIRERCLSREAHTPPFTSSCAYAMSHISYEGQIEISTLKKLLRCSKRQLHSTIETLHARNLISIEGDIVKVHEHDSSFVISSIIVIEAKLNKWKHAINQAERHLWLTDTSYVLLPGDREQIISKAAQECSRRQIGLITVSPTGDYKMVVEPPSNTVYHNYQTWIMNEFIAERYCVA